MLTHDEIARFYKVLGEEPIRSIYVDANEIERLMPRIVERRGSMHIEPPHPENAIDYGSNQWYIEDIYQSTAVHGDTLAEAVARWVLAQEEEACE